MIKQMVLAKLLSNENGIVRYSYQPDKEGEPGVLLYDIEKNQTKIEKLAENDGKSTFSRNPVFRMIRENIHNLPKERLIIWY